MKYNAQRCVYAKDDFVHLLTKFNFQVYYKTCPEITQSFATYPETPTGKTEGSIDKVHLSCIQNA